MMSSDRLVVVGVAGAILAVTLATGPVGLLAVDAPEDPFAQAGTGNATVETVSIPDAVTVHDEGQGVSRVAVPATTVRVSDRRGNPLLRYRLSIETTTTTTTHALGDWDPGTHEVTIDRQPRFDAGELANVSTATLDLVLVHEGGETTVFERTVEVDHG